MPLDPFDWLPVGRTALRIMRLGLGTAPIGGLYRAVTDEQAERMCRHAWDIGVRSFDTAPLYGYGLAERRLGRVLREQPRDSYVVSTKVGRLIRPASAEELARPDNFKGTPPDRAVWDFSRDGVLRSIEESLERLGLDRIDIVFIHDPDDHWRPAIEEAYPALDDLRAQGVVRAIGAGMNQAEMLARFTRDADMDIHLCAGRYTLLDQSALRELLPVCLERRTSVVIGGLMNSGILADPSPGAPFNYAPAQNVWLQRAQHIRAVCERHGVSLRDAAIQFPLAHPAVVAVAAGVREPAHLDEYPAAMSRTIPSELWDELRAEGLIDPVAPIPA
jgi:D-threo-aldose 1-dehydrogenase